MRFALLALFLSPLLSAAEWTIAYFYDKPTAVLHFTDIAFPSALRGIAVGNVEDQLGQRRPRPVEMVTSDGGKTWAEIKLNDAPYSLFFLDDSTGWMVTESGIWKTDESGRTWKRISKHSAGSLLRVHFLDANHGFAVGREKTVLETQDGGKTWKPVPAAQEPTGNRSFAVYSQIAFLNGQSGIITGSAVPPTRRGLSANNRQIPTMTIQLQTMDGGKTWKPSSAPLLGIVTALKLRGANGLALFTFADTFEVPSEVYRLNTKGGDSVSTFKAKNRRVTDVALFDGHAFLAAVEPPPLAKEAGGLPGKIHVLESTDLMEWNEIKVDYRATGAEPILAGPDPEHLFLATDSGMILRFIP
ncbi:MAG: YCF48-related protein [Bryobacteraceae bacterium]